MNDARSIAQRAMARVEARPKPLTQQQIDAEKEKCKKDAAYFISTYCKIYDNDTRSWITFVLWSFQEDALQQMCASLRLVALKTRQIGLTWLCLAYALWQMLFHPIAEVLAFSQREDEALALVSDQRLKGMYKALPEWMKPGVTIDSAHEFRFSNGSGIRALPATAGGDSRTVTLVIIDEADLVDGLGPLMDRAEPTLGQSGQLFVVGRADKSKPNSAFKRLYKEAKKSLGKWAAIFIPWHAHPKRTKEWYDALCREAMSKAGTLDGVHEHYPATDVEALSARSLDKRFSPEWMVQIQSERQPMVNPPGAPDVVGLKVFSLPEPGRRYGIGGDPAGGKSDGDDAAGCVVDALTYEQVAVFGGKVEPSQFGKDLAAVSRWYFNAPINFELNNHGHEVRKTLKEEGANLKSGVTKQGPSKNPGWLTTDWSKALMYDTAAKVILECLEEARQSGEEVGPIIFDFTTAAQVASISIDADDYLKAPEGEHDDYAVAWGLALVCVFRGAPSMEQVPHRGLWNRDDPSPSRREAGGEVAPPPYTGPGSDVPPHILERFGRIRK